MDKKELIIKAAIDEFYEKGFDTTSIASIAERAAIGKGTVYLYFTSKDELITACYQYCYQMDVDACKKGLDEIDNCVDKLCRRMDNIIDFATTCYKESKIERMCGFYKGGVLVKKEMFDDIETVIKEGIIKGEIKNIRSDLLASAYYGLASGIYTKSLQDPSVIDADFLNSVHCMIGDLLKK